MRDIDIDPVSAVEGYELSAELTEDPMLAADVRVEERPVGAPQTRWHAEELRI